MPCYSPLDAFQACMRDGEGKRKIAFKPFPDCKKIHLPCGQCVGCRLERSRQWAVRCLHEASLYTSNCFLTLTFNDDALYRRRNPVSLDLRDFQNFMKRLRKKYNGFDKVVIGNRDTYPIRFYHCGEYGERNRRPHYHALLFNFDFFDKKLWKVENGNRLYTSEILQSIWSDPVTKEPYGHCIIGDVTFESAAYVARYIMKKINGDLSDYAYTDFDARGVVLAERVPEYTTMSRRPGIGRWWYDRYAADTYKDDKIIARGIAMRPPKFYDNLLKAVNPELFEKIQFDRLTVAERYADNNTPERLSVRELVQNRKLTQLPRKV